MKEKWLVTTNTPVFNNRTKEFECELCDRDTNHWHCPVCQRKLSHYIEKHHWRYGEDEITVRVCHSCHIGCFHNYGTKTQMEQLATITELDSWIDLAILSVIHRHPSFGILADHGEFQVIKDRLSLPVDYVPDDMILNNEYERHQVSLAEYIPESEGGWS